MQNNSSNENTAATTASKAPGYAAFTAALIASFADAGVPLVPVAEDGAKDGLRGPEGWVLFEVEGTGDKLYARRTKTGAPTMIETSVPFEQIPTELVVKDMRKGGDFDGNGRIEARIKPDVEEIAAKLIPVLAKRRADGQTIRARRVPASR